MTSTQLCILPPVFLSSNVLVLAWTNGVEDAPYDLFMTTNLAPGATFLNLTNWAWLYRSAPGQTNFTLTNYPVPEAYFALGTTNDTDADGLTDAFELLVSHSLPGTNDSDGDGLLDGWMWQHFGHALASASDNTRAQDDYDSDGVSNLDEFNAGTDPNTVRFTAHVGYGHVNTTAPTATIEVLKGVPSELAVLVDDENRAGAQWQAFAASPPLSLPASDGAHRVWLGLRGRTESGAVWLGFTVTLDRQPPAVFLTSPETAATSKPYLQLRGYSPEDLRGVSCTLSNAAGVQTNLLGVITGASGPTNRFQCFDVALTNGANALALSVTDLAGNVTSTNLSVTLDYSGDTNAPAWAVHWPRHGERIGANTFTLRGWVDDETASVTAVITSASTTNTAGGTVERNGAVWVDNLPLAAGTNWVTLTARDAAGNLSTTNLAVVKSSVTLTMETPAPSALTQPRVTVSGSISASGYRVWVNGVAAYPVGGNWSASNVPVTPGGSAVFALTAIPLTANGGNGTPPAGSGSDPANLNPTSADAVNVAGQPEKDPEVKLVTGEWEAHDLELGLIGSAYYAWDYAWHYSETNGGYAERTHTEPMGAGEVMSGSRCWVDTNGTLRFEHWVESPTNTTSTNEMLLTDMMWGGFRVDRPWAKGEWQHGYVEGWGYYETGDIAKNTRVVLRTGGRAGLPRKNLFMVSATPRERTATGWRDIEPTQVLIPALGKNLGSDHRAFGTLPDNEEVLLSPEAKAAYYNFDSLGATKHKLEIRRGTDISWKTNVAVVGEKVALTCALNPSIPGLTNFQWTIPGYAISNYVANTNVGLLFEQFPTTNSNVAFYWVDGDQKRVLVEATVGDQVASVNTTFDVARPTADWIAEPNALVTVDNNHMYHALHFGYIDSTNKGMLFHFRNPQMNGCPAGWLFRCVQIGSTYSRVNYYTNNVGAEIIDSGLDTAYPMNGWASAPGDDSDGPAQWTENRFKVQREDRFSTYLLYDPLLLDSIPVPIKKLEWYWGGLACTNGAGDWVLLSSPTNYGVIKNNEDTMEFPTWTRNLKDRTNRWTTWF